MSKAKLMNELIKQSEHYLKNKSDREISNYYFGFLDACKIVLTEEQVLVAMNEGNKKFQNQ